MAKSRVCTFIVSDIQGISMTMPAPGQMGSGAAQIYLQIYQQKRSSKAAHAQVCCADPLECLQLVTVTFGESRLRLRWGCG